jgi:hypothetical protein
MRDETYILDLCDFVMAEQSLRQHRFDFLLGDPDKLGRRRRLPVDAYYPDAKLVIEYRERQHTETVLVMDRRMTISGCPRSKQRRIYDKRRRTQLRMHGYVLVEIDYAMFAHDRRKRLVRNLDSDVAQIRAMLRDVGLI